MGSTSSLRRYLLLIPSSVFFIMVPVVTLIAGEVLDEALKLELNLWPTASTTVGTLFLVSGGYFVLESIRILLVTGKGIPLGDLIPSDQSKVLLIEGVFSMTRNPMLFGYLLALSGVGLLILSFSATFIFPLLYTALWTAWIKVLEEPALERRFGDEYRRYREETPFLVPKLFTRKR
jgi:protein-S-isoprenylcysteine O-methyltransferase Ste14